ncbi:hypothetical protein [Minwuia sp. IMCC3060]|uniref:relaxase/mobilization nuclease domain-containing protein n=1 Tax=Minwuia sp. IMCC3060 TaxID=3040675 RepID=UPI002479F08B|nr:hypothetical protein [Minwuia sp. IMCC3060]
MILVGNQRGGAKDLARHLMKQDNEHVSVHELRGFVADDLDGAFTESYAISRGTKCRQFLFSLSLNPPPDEEVSTADFEAAIDRAEAKLGLTGQPRAVVFHEKEGPGGMRRHAHAVWSRIRADEMKAVQMSHSHRKLMDMSRELYLEHGWKMPRGLADQKNRDPRNFTLEEWQQARRAGRDAKDLKASIQDAWAISDTKTAFSNALLERGLWLARGDRRGYVAVDYEGEVFSLSRWAGVKTKHLRERLGDEKSLSSVEDATARMAAAMTQKMDVFQKELASRKQAEQQRYETQRIELVERQRAERKALSTAQAQREMKEHQDRQARLRGGVKGLWDRLTGARNRIIEENMREADLARLRDLAERERMVSEQLEQRRDLIAERKNGQRITNEHAQTVAADKRRYDAMVGSGLVDHSVGRNGGAVRRPDGHEKRQNRPTRTPETKLETAQPPAEDRNARLQAFKAERRGVPDQQRQARLKLER